MALLAMLFLAPSNAGSAEVLSVEPDDVGHIRRDCIFTDINSGRLVTVVVLLQLQAESRCVF
jgi:hypothetical protein